MDFKSSKIRWVMALTFALFVTLAIIVTITSIHGTRAAASPSGATIASDQADYAPGSTVTLTGAGWASDEAVHIHVSDSDGTTWSLDSNPDPVVDTSGSFTYQFSLPSTVIAYYSVTATGATSGTATTAFTDSNCPSLSGKVASNLVGASSSGSGDTLTYTFSSVNESPSGGVPGLIDYCVFPTGSTPLLPTGDTVQATGANSSHWVYNSNTDNFFFSRPDGGGNAVNIQLDGQTITMGTATWSGSVPTSQKILLHINDKIECAKLYPTGTEDTCWVLPGTPQQAKDLTVSKTATPSFTRTYTWGITKSVDQTEQKIAAGGKATFTYIVEVTHDGGTDSGWQVTGMITVNNPNGFDVTGVNVTDTIDNNGSCTVTNGTGLTVPKNSSIKVSYTCTYSSAPSQSSGTNTATASWTNIGSPHTSAQGTAAYDFRSVNPKVVDGSITVVDDKTDPANPVTLGTADYTQASPIDFKYSLDLAGKDGTCTDYTNTAKIDGTTQTASQKVTVCAAEDLSVSKTATPSFTRTFKWGIAKAVDQTKVIDSSGSAMFNYTVTVTHDSGTDSDWKVNGTITVSNPNNFEDVTGVNVTDAIDNGGTCVVTGGTNVTVPAGQSVTLDYICTYSSAPTSNSGTNTATANWDQAKAHSPSGTAQGTASYDFGSVTPKLVDDSVSVSDTLGGTLGTASSTDPGPKTFTYSYTVTGKPGICVSQDNTATFTTNTNDITGSDSKTVQMCTPEDPTVSKTASTAYVLTYGWSIKKSVDKTLVEQIGGGTATFNYTVEVTHDAGTESWWTVSGTITVSNPNDFEDVTGVKVTDAIDNGGTCAVTGGTNVTVPAGQSVTLDYICTYSSAPSPRSGTNTATANWDQKAASTPHGTTQGTASYDFNQANVTVNNGIITVVDDKTNPANPITLGTVGYTDPSPKDFTYALTLNVPTTNCVKYTNTAGIVETKQTASQTVEVCGPAKTGALTMGFWQNKNGQGIISAADQTKLGSFLRTYHPFSDAPSTSLATYVYNIIKVANCSGTTCNTMLRAQMLATALDVYFSDPVLGGNKINAPAPIGGMTIDLTKICRMIDGSGGTATCSGAYENVSSAFGGATSMTVSQMLAYQSTSDPAADAGVVWYNQVKATQVLAKDAFDAINNQVAFAP